MSRMVNLKSSGLLLLLLAVVIAVIYLPALDVPFYLDDSESIQNRMGIYESESLSYLWTDNERRSLSYSTFWLDVNAFGASLSAFHITNIAIHLLTTFMVFGFAKRLITAVSDTTSASWLALAIAALWALHPINSQAVIYVVQRMTSLAALFMLVAMYGWLYWRTSEAFRAKSIGLSLVIAGAFLAWHSKENAAVLPLLWFAIDVVVKPRAIRHWLQAFAALLLLLALVLPVAALVSPTLLQSLDSASRETAMYTRAEYFWAQQEVLFSYLGKWLWPDPLLLFYPFYQGGSAAAHAILLFGHVGIIIAAVCLRRVIPLLTFGLLMFYIGHLVESSIIPIKDLAFEHRNYLPSVGLAIATVGLVRWLVAKMPIGQRIKPVMVGALVLTLSVFAAVTYQRAIAWQDPFSFHKDEFKEAGDNPNAKLMWAIELAEKEQYQDAELLFKDVVDYYQKNQAFNVVAADNYLRVMQAQGGYYQSIGPAIKMLAKVEDPRARSKLLTTLAIAYIELDGCDMASGFLNKAVQLDPTNEQAQQYAQRCANE